MFTASVVSAESVTAVRPDTPAAPFAIPLRAVVGSPCCPFRLQMLLLNQLSYPDS